MQVFLIFVIPAIFKPTTLIVAWFLSKYSFYTIQIDERNIQLKYLWFLKNYEIANFTEYFFSGMGVGQRVHLCFAENHRHIFFTPGEREAFIAELDAILERNRRESRKNKSKD
jgi:hypothetical protein